MGAAPEPLSRAVMLQDWRDVTFLHWPVEPAAVRRLLPGGVELDTFGGAAWVGVVAMSILRTRPPGLPAPSWPGSFPETNVRTYVRGPGGRPDVWFHSLDAARLPVVLAARAGLGLPYQWSRMAVDRGGGRLRYRSVRRWPGPCDARALLEVEVGPPLPAAAVTGLDRFLVDRWGLLSRWRGRLLRVPVEHPPWPLARVELRRLDQDLVEAAGLPAVAGAPHLLHSPGLAVRVGPPRRAG